MSRTVKYSVFCLILITLTSISSSNAADLQTPTGSKQKTIKSESFAELSRADVAPTESLAQNKTSTDAVSREKPAGNAFEVPLPSAVWLMAGGLLALVLIRRRNR
jgi:hypothetical protein